eukprot:jgi/Astpho2/1908/Aster-00427
MQLINSRQLCSLECTSQRQPWSCRGCATVRRQVPSRTGSRAQPGRLQRLTIRAEQQKGSTKAKEDDKDLPPWVRTERARELAAQADGLPFGVYLLGAAIVSIAAVGSLFEIANKNPIFGVVKPDSPLYLPILLFFGVTGFPTAGFLFFKCVEKANQMAERMDQQDGY